MPSKDISPNANTTNPRSNCPHALTTYFTRCQHLKPPFELPSCPQKVFHTVPTPQTPFQTAPMPSKHISPNANTTNPRSNCPHALTTYFTRCQHLKPPFQLSPCPQNTFPPVPTPQTPFSTAPMPSKHISHSANTSNPLFNPPPCPQNIYHTVPTPQTRFSNDPMPSKNISHSANTSNPLLNCPHALKKYFTQCQHLKRPFVLPPCPQNIFHAVPTPQIPFTTAPMPSKHISPNSNTSNPLFKCPHALKTHSTQCQHLQSPFQLPSCPQNTFHPMPTPQIPFSTHPMPSKSISPSVNTSNPLFNCPHALKIHFTQCQHLTTPFQLPPCPQNTFHPMPTPQIPFSTHPMPSKHISPSVNTSNPLFNCPHALKIHFTQCQHLTPPFQLPLCPQNTFNPPVPTPRNPISTGPMPSKHISPSANTSNPLFKSPHALNTYFTQWQHLKPHFQLPPCPENTFHPMPTPHNPFPTAPMPSSHIYPTSANTSNPLFNCPHALKTYFTQCQHLKPPSQLPPCPENIFHTVPTSQTPFSTAPMPSKHISHSVNALTPPSELPPCPENIFHTVPTPQTPFSTALMRSKHISPGANSSKPLSNCPHALETYFTQCQHLTPRFQLPLCPENIFHTVPTPQTPFSTALMRSKHISPGANSSKPLSNCPHALETYFTQCQHLTPRFQLPLCPENIFHTVPTPQTPFSTALMPSKHISPGANSSKPLSNCTQALETNFTQCQHLKPRFQLPPCPENTFHTVPTPTKRECRKLDQCLSLSLIIIRQNHGMS